MVTASVFPTELVPCMWDAGPAMPSTCPSSDRQHALEGNRSSHPLGQGAPVGRTHPEPSRRESELTSRRAQAPSAKQVDGRAPTLSALGRAGGLAS